MTMKTDKPLFRFHTFFIIYNFSIYSHCRPCSFTLFSILLFVLFYFVFFFVLFFAILTK